MAHTLSTLLGKPRSLVVELDGEAPITVSYYPRYFTPKFEMALHGFGVAEDGAHRAKEAADIASEVIAGWDLVDAKGKPLPCTRENWDYVATEIAWEIINACLNDTRPKAPSDEASPAG